MKDISNMSFCYQPFWKDDFDNGESKLQEIINNDVIMTEYTSCAPSERLRSTSGVDSDSKTK